MKFAIQPVLAAGFAAAVLAVGFVGVATYGHLREEQADIALLNQSEQIVSALDSTVLLCTTAQSAVRGFVITADEKFLKPFYEASDRLAVVLADLRVRVRDDPAQRRQLGEVEGSVALLLSFQHELVEVSRQRGFLVARDRINSGRGPAHLRAVQAATARMRMEEQRQRSAWSRAAELSAAYAHAMATVLVTTALALLALCYLLVRHVLAQRLEREKVLRALAATLDDRVRERTAQLEIAQRHQAHLAAIVESSTDAIVSVDLQQRFATWNRGAERLLGYRADEMVAQPIWTVIPPDREEEMRSVMHALLHGESVPPYETARRHKDGRIIPVIATASPVRDDQGQVLGASGILRDITERKRLEAEVLRVSDYEQQRLGHDLHDGIGQQLTAIELMLHQVAEETDPARRTAAVERLGDNLRAAIREVRLLARGLAPYIVDSGGLQSALASLVHAPLPASVRCEFRCGEAMPSISPSVALHLYRIAQEAFNNAIKYSGASEIVVELESRTDALRLVVRDNGRGCGKAEDATSGMGRQIMRYRAGLIGAEYTFASGPGCGVTVICSVPLHHE